MYMYVYIHIYIYICVCVCIGIRLSHQAFIRSPPASECSATKAKDAILASVEVDQITHGAMLNALDARHIHLRASKSLQFKGHALDQSRKPYVI